MNDIQFEFGDVGQMNDAITIFTYRLGLKPWEIKESDFSVWLNKVFEKGIISRPRGLEPPFSFSTRVDVEKVAGVWRVKK